MIYIFSQTRFLFLYFFLHFLCRFQSTLGRIAAGNHESYIRQMFFFVQQNSSGGGSAMGDGLYDFIMTVCGTGCLRQMRNTEDLNGMREEGNLSGHLKATLPLMPTSISSKIKVCCWRRREITISMARAIREISPPEAVSFMLRRGSPILAEK